MKWEVKDHQLVVTTSKIIMAMPEPYTYEDIHLFLGDEYQVVVKLCIWLINVINQTGSDEWIKHSNQNIFLMWKIIRKIIRQMSWNGSIVHGLAWVLAQIVAGIKIWLTVSCVT
jgi:hypothetical protein